MRTAIVLLLLAALAPPAPAASRRKQCQTACASIVDTCSATLTALGFGELGKGCRRTVLGRCKRTGLRACALTCGDGRADTGEACDGADLAGASCQTVGFVGGTLACSSRCTFDTSGCTAGAFPASGQTTSVVAGDDGALRRGAPLRYRDNGDGTIIDLNTGLVWEKKSDDAGLHFKDLHHPWTGPGSIFEWVAELNAEGGTGFAGHADWRVPNVRELQSIVDYERMAPSVDPVFETGCTPGCTVPGCSCTEPAPVWTSTSFTTDPNYAWTVDFANGFVGNDLKTALWHGRAVRGP